MSTRNRISPKIIDYGLYLNFLGLSFRNTAKASFLHVIKISMFLSGHGYKNTDHRNITRIRKSKST